jgi:hypothetical protein
MRRPRRGSRLLALSKLLENIFDHDLVHGSEAIAECVSVRRGRAATLGYDRSRDSCDTQPLSVQ